MVEFILMDIEGTTTSIHFVHQVLFPYSVEKMESFVKTHQEVAEVKAVTADFQKILRDEQGKSGTLDEVIALAKQWISEDRKHATLKNLQGLMWKMGYESGDLKGHVYDDVPEALERWKKQGKKMGIYSSGSVLAQKLLFAYTAYGSLNPYLSANFDTEVGHKRSADSYRQISQRLSIEPKNIVFLSDVIEEIQAANDAGFKTVHIIRDGPLTPGKFIQAADFRDLNF